MRHLGGKPALFQTKLPGGAVSAQPRPSQALSGACCARHMQDPNQTYSWQRYSFRRQACQGCPDTGRKSAPALGAPSQEDSAGKSVKLIILLWRQFGGKNMVSAAGAGERAIWGHPLISVSLFHHSGMGPPC